MYNLKTERKLTKKIRHIIKKIENGYKIIDSYIDGCDEYGLIRYFDCENGYYGESWEVDIACSNSISERKLNIINNGIIYNKTKYYIHPNLYYKHYYDKDLVKIISENEHKKLLKVRKDLENIILKINNKIDDYEKGLNINNINFVIHNDILYRAKGIFDYSPKHSYKDFLQYIRNTKNNTYKSRELLINIINLDDFKQEREILGIGTELIK